MLAIAEETELMMASTAKKRKPREYWLTPQNIKGRLDVADVWYFDPSKKPWWRPQWKKPVHVREVK
jgi:hypothetical protein